MSHAVDSEGDSDDDFSECSGSEGSESGYEEIDIDEFSDLVGDRTVAGNTDTGPRKSDLDNQTTNNAGANVKPSEPTTSIPDVQNPSLVRESVESECEPKLPNKTVITEQKSPSNSKGPSAVKKESINERSVYLNDILQRNRSIVNQKKEELSQRNLLGILSRKHNSNRDYSMRSASYGATIEQLETDNNAASHARNQATIEQLEVNDAASRVRKFGIEVDPDLLKAEREASASCPTSIKHGSRRKNTYENDPAYTCTRPKKDMAPPTDETDCDKPGKRSSSRRNVGKVSYAEFESDSDTDEHISLNIAYQAVSSVRTKTPVPQTTSITPVTRSKTPVPQNRSKSPVPQNRSKTPIPQTSSKITPVNETEPVTADDTLEDVSYKTGQYICQKCRKKFGNLYSLAKHMGSHTEEYKLINNVPKLEIDQDHSNEAVNKRVENNADGRKVANETEKRKNENPIVDHQVEVKLEQNSCDQGTSARLTRKSHIQQYSVEIEHEFMKYKRTSSGVTTEKPCETNTSNALKEVLSYRMKTEPSSMKQGSDSTAANKPNSHKASTNEPEDIKKTESDLNDENEQEYGPVFICAVCNKSFNELSKLEKHVTSHIPQEVFSCGVCSKQFCSTDTLLIHMEKHQCGLKTNPRTVAELKAYLKEKKTTANSTKRPSDDVITLSDSNEDYDADSDETEVIQFDKSTGKKRTFKKGKPERGKRLKTDSVANTSGENSEQKSETKKNFKSYLRQTQAESDVVMVDSDTNASGGNIKRKFEGKKNNMTNSFRNVNTRLQSSVGKPETKKNTVKKTPEDNDVVIVDADSSVEPDVIIIDDVEESNQSKKIPTTDPNAISKLLNYRPKVTFP